ncbi:MAG: MBL fold metallo-hydrolase [Spirochaetales bacterium]|nr:MBL fold metallo-hydrolase [Spirochaetales bacterium]
MQIHTIPAGPLETNVFLIDNGAGEALIIDAPPGGYEAAMAVAQEKGLAVKALLLTHGHFDHVLDTARYQEAGIPVYVHRDSEEMVRDPASAMPFPMPGIELDTLEWGSDDQILEEETTLTLAGLNIQVLNAPGHCPGSVIFHVADLKAAFVGDVIFYRSVGRTDLPGGNGSVLFDSIRTKVFTLPDETLLHPGHGPLTLVEEEKQFNPYSFYD